LPDPLERLRDLRVVEQVLDLVDDPVEVGVEPRVRVDVGDIDVVGEDVGISVGLTEGATTSMRNSAGVPNDVFRSSVAVTVCVPGVRYPRGGLNVAVATQSVRRSCATA